MQYSAYPQLPQTLSPEQREVIAYPREGEAPLFVQGAFGTGKTTALLARLCALVREGRRPYEILVLVPQRAQAERFEQALASLSGPSRGKVDTVTFYGFARRAVALFWPLVAKAAGFCRPQQEPTFLTIETTQYFMWRIVEPLIQREGYFSALAIRRGRLLSQLIDNLNKAALVGFPYTEILPRLRSAWTGSEDHVNAYWQAQDCAIRFRAY
ncbi:MAG: DEAD/DEAH box helicase family protein, partial [Chloroflexi bacterium]|nr:DEAD/DEAH box helicase family protein [Chloroflexota bacterium]